jgi:1,2-diacylglycerol 3-alpha-glucosyltransferase
MKIAVLFHRLGPYHLARLQAASKLCQLHAIELSSVDDTYLWDTVADQLCFARSTLFTDGDVNKKSSLEIMAALERAFARIEPEVVAIPGWSGRPAFSALALCRRLDIPAVAMSESTEHDEVRRGWKEWIKKRVVRNYAAGLVGGRLHGEYLRKLGMSRDRIFTGYDVVDNTHFSLGAAHAQQNEAQLRLRYNLPQHYFLSSNRFIPKKNIDRLVRAFGRYREHAGTSGWKLVILGDGELRPQIEDLIVQLGLDADVLLPGFKQYPDLPVYYGLAKAYVHASTTEQWGLVVNEAMASGLPVIVSERCGCAADLVKKRENGFTFDPYNIQQLTELLVKMSSNAVDLAAMGMASKIIISNWTVEKFAQNLILAAKAALVARQSPLTIFDRLILGALGCL